MAQQTSSPEQPTPHSEQSTPRYNRHTPPQKHRARRGFSTFVFIALPVLCILISLGVGSYPINPADILKIFYGRIVGQELVSDSIAVGLVWQVRLPRIIAAVLVGAGLSVAGAVFQGLFKNPLASPYTLGVSNGAGFGASLAIVLSLSSLYVQASAIACGLISVGLTFLIASRAQKTTVTLILSGMLVGSLFSSLISLIKFVADPFDKLPTIVFWLMGSLAGADYNRILAILPFYLVAMAILYLFRWKINVLSMGDQEARSYGIDVRRDRGIAIVACSVITALVVSISGIIGWVGIVIPHLARMITGPDFRRIIPVSMSLGICYLLIIDDLCRSLTATEIPIGVITGIIGVPLFIYFIYQKKVRW